MLALFEEIGWRGWLLPRLAGRISRRRAVLISSSHLGSLARAVCTGGHPALGRRPAIWTVLITQTSAVSSLPRKIANQGGGNIDQFRSTLPSVSNHTRWAVVSLRCLRDGRWGKRLIVCNAVRRWSTAMTIVRREPDVLAR